MQRQTFVLVNRGANAVVRRLGLRRFRGGDLLMLTTVGRTSGKTRTTPLLYLAEATGGSSSPPTAVPTGSPGWWLNVRAGSPATVTLDGRSTPVVGDRDHRARARGDVGRLRGVFDYDSYQVKVSRRLAVVALTPAAARRRPGNRRDPHHPSATKRPGASLGAAGTSRRGTQRGGPSMVTTPFGEHTVLESEQTRIVVEYDAVGHARLEVTASGYRGGSAEAARLACAAVHEARLHHAGRIDGALDASRPACGAILEALHEQVGHDLDSIAMRRAGSTVIVTLETHPLLPVASVPEPADRRRTPLPTDVAALAR